MESYKESLGEKEIKKEQLMLLYENTIDDSFVLFSDYKLLYKRLNKYDYKNLVQDMMKAKLNQCIEIREIYEELVNGKYMDKKITPKKMLRVKDIFVEECNYSDSINYIYSNINEMPLMLRLNKVIHEQNLLMIKLMYLQNLIGYHWQTNNK